MPVLWHYAPRPYTATLYAHPGIYPDVDRSVNEPVSVGPRRVRVKFGKPSRVLSFPFRGPFKVSF